MNRVATQALDGTDDGNLPMGLLIEIAVNDPELIRELVAFPDGSVRDEYALKALRIGLIALKQARGQIDADSVRREGERLLHLLEGKLDLHAQSLYDALSGSLKEYFNPEGGRFNERIERLIEEDGELERVLRKQIGEKDSELCKTLLAHTGPNSELMSFLSPAAPTGLMQSVTHILNTAFIEQRDGILAEFSLDNNEGALKRLVEQLRAKNEELSLNIQERIDRVAGELSLDKRDSALNRLLRRVAKDHSRIRAEFSLDNADSALSRMSQSFEKAGKAIEDNLTLDNASSAMSRLKNEVFELLTKHSTSAQEFYSEVRETLNEFKIRREESQRSTVHGLDFEDVAFEFIQADSQRSGDVATFTGDTVGSIKNCKIGDATIEFAPDHAAAGARIVVEAKDNNSYTLQKARDEIALGRKNREAHNGIFVFARSSAPAGLAPFQRIGEDLFVVWDHEDTNSDIYLRAAIMVARALAVREARRRDSADADFSGIERAINEVEKKTEGLEEIKTSAETISKSADKILNRVRLCREGISSQVTNLRKLIADVASVIQPSAV